MSDLKSKLNGIFGILNSHREEFKETPDEFERRMKLARDEMLAGTKYSRATNADILPKDFAEEVGEPFRKLCTELDMEMYQIRIYNLSMILSQHSLYDAYEARAEALGLPLESVIIASLKMGVSLEGLLGYLERVSYKPATEHYGYSSMSFVFDEGDMKRRELMAGESDTYEDSISSLKKRIKYCKNPMEKKNLEKELNALYKSRKRRK